MKKIVFILSLMAVVFGLHAQTGNNSIIAKTKCAKIENETSKTSLFFASFFLLASGFVKCKLNAD